MMDNVREKLVELIEESRIRKTENEGYCICGSHIIADHLIAHGVTVQEWIPVTERKPDLELVEAKTEDIDLYSCLATIKNDRARSGRYVGKVWYDGIGFIDGDRIDITCNVTHWMPLPTPPKGE